MFSMFSPFGIISEMVEEISTMPRPGFAMLDG